ncbi:MAG: glycosyltransferase family 2 protein [Alphaproteobacteria bacterium]
MAEVSIGVPVFNGADFLEGSLQCLRDQTFRDIEVLIFDNCSEDATGEIAKRFCEVDPRFRYVRHEYNRGAVPNFAASVEAAQSKFFMWRAADDTSSLDYVERLHRLLLSNPDRDIAVPKTLEITSGGKLLREKANSPRVNDAGIAGRVAQIFKLYPDWIYGLFRRDTMVPSIRRVLAEYPYTWDWDTASLFPFAFHGRVIGDNEALLYKVIHPAGPPLTRAQRTRRKDEKVIMARCLTEYKHRLIEEAKLSQSEKWMFHALITYYTLTGSLSVSRRIRFAVRSSMGYVQPATKS